MSPPIQARSTSTSRRKRDRLITAELLALVGSLARGIQKRLPPSFDLDDLVGSGMLGLLDAATKYDQKRQIPFSAYARIRIRGEILETVRRRRYISQTTVELPDLPVKSDYDQPIRARELESGVTAALSRLPQREAYVIRRHYLEGEALCRIARRLRLSPCRVSQLHLSALSRLRSDHRLHQIAD